MPYIVTENCIKCKHTDCVSVCPVDCFHEGTNFVVIDPAECIDCGMCEPECPVNAIQQFDEKSSEHQLFLNLNREMSSVWPSITERKDAPFDAAHWDGVHDKLQMLVR